MKAGTWAERGGSPTTTIPPPACKQWFSPVTLQPLGGAHSCRLTGLAWETATRRESAKPGSESAI